MSETKETKSQRKKKAAKALEQSAKALKQAQEAHAKKLEEEKLAAEEKRKAILRRKQARRSAAQVKRQRGPISRNLLKPTGLPVGIYGTSFRSGIPMVAVDATEMRESIKQVRERVKREGQEAALKRLSSFDLSLGASQASK